VHEIRHSIAELIEYNEKYYLRWSPLKKLRLLNQRWDTVLEKISELKLKVERAPSALTFYNTMTLLKVKHQQENEKEMEVGQKLTNADEALKKALDYVIEHDRQHSIGVFGASVLEFNQARKNWKERTKRIERLKKEGAEVDLIVRETGELVKNIYDTPVMAKWVNDVEKRFNRLCYDHELLINSFGKEIIPRDLLDEYTNVLHSAVPQLWSCGQKEQLSQRLAEVENFINMYQPEVESEIAFMERHQPRQISSPSETAEQLSRLIELTKVFISAMDVRDPMMRMHSLNVAHLAVTTSQIMNWEEEDIQYLEVAALLHDVGKIWIPESILAKRSKLTQEEVKIMQMHPAYGAQILQSSGLFKEVSRWIFHHQELWNGSGYPDGLRGEDIPIQSRIISVCEAFDSMLSGSPSKQSLSVEQALDRMKFESGTYFDPIIVDAFVKAVETKEMEYLHKYVEK